MTATTGACRAPSVSLYLDPLGIVRPCCANPWYVLGRIGEQPLADIWNGERTRQLRARLDAGDLSGGCDACRGPIEAGDRSNAFARIFDDLPSGGRPPDPTWPVELQLALSNTCNLQCTMCNGTLSSAIRSGREHLPPLPTVYDDRFFADLKPFLEHVERISFLGGEPLLARETWRVIDLLQEVHNRPRLQITTNGTIWNDRVERLLSSFPTDVAVSVDAVDHDVMRAIRVGIDPERVEQNLRRFKASAPVGGGSLAIAHCVMVENWQELRSVLHLGDELDVDVFLNDVTWPVTSSIWALTAAERAEVLNGLRARQARSAPLGRNQRAWDEALTRIATASSSPTEVEVVLAGRAGRESAPVRLVVDDLQRLSAIVPDPADVFGVDLTPLLGCPIVEWMEPFQAVHGRLQRSALTRGAGGVETWTLELGTPGSTRSLYAVYHPEPSGGGRFELTFAEDPAAR